VIDLLVESRIKLDALEHLLKETNPLVHELISARLKIYEPTKQRK